MTRTKFEETLRFAERKGLLASPYEEVLAQYDEYRPSKVIEFF